MCPPVPEAHPAEVVFAVEALHVVAATVLLNTDVALGAIFSVSGDVVGSLAVVSTFVEPLPDCLAIRGGVVRVGALETELGLAGDADDLLGHAVLGLHHDITVGTRTKAEVGVAADVVDEGEVDVPLPDGRVSDVGQDQVLVHQIVTAGVHAGEGGGDPGLDLRLTVIPPALTTETVAAALQSSELTGREVGGADQAQLGLRRGRSGGRAISWRRGHSVAGFCQDFRDVPFIGVQELLRPGVTQTQTTPHCLDALVEDLLHVCHRQTLVGEIFWVIVVIKLTGPNLLVVRDVIVCKVSVRIQVLSIRVIGVFVGLMVTHLQRMK